jgi:2-succinyl-5-enolpyruvyl-6-hydroxy-3-cyclohexene-1-carboxylate synthase
MMNITSDKPIVQALVQCLTTLGLKHAVISPGSRNAPLIIAFTGNSHFKCYSIVDERSAAYYAMGMARQLNEPVVVICTSGTAVLNLAPALAEAYYQEVPVIAITADRPSEWIDQEDGQTIRQSNIFKNYIKYSCLLPDERTLNALESTYSELKNLMSEVKSFPKGPMHINIPLAEPLYGQVESPENQITEKHDFNFAKKHRDLNIVSELWEKSPKILMVAGVILPDPIINTLINQISRKYNIPVIAAATSNIYGIEIINTPESLITSLKDEELEVLRPDLLITIGRSVISKKLKQFIRKNKPTYHIDIDLNPLVVDTYRCLTHKIMDDIENCLEFILLNCTVKEAGYHSLWIESNKILKERHSMWLENLPWSDFYIYHQLIEKSGLSVDLHLANSTPVRYAELFAKAPQINYYANRGTSGIDGCLSTAAGAALVSGQPTLVITGDVGFFYDSNCFYNNQLPSNLKVVLINNGGGGIFDILPGPKTSPDISYFTTPHSFDAKGICQAFKVKYFKASSKKEFYAIFNKFLDSNECSVLEVETNQTDNSAIYRKYFSVIANC